jgi:alpha-glucosidase
MLLLTLRGTPTLYYGDEIGLENGVIPPDRVQDPAEKNEPGLGLGRDPERTPMQWDASPQAGFTTGVPWLPVSDDFHRRNVEVLAQDATSVLSLYKRLLELRRSRPALSTGRYAPVTCDGNVMSYQRENDGERLLIVLNLGHASETAAMAERAGSVLLSTHLDRTGERVSSSCKLRPDEGAIIELSPAHARASSEG